MIAIAPMIAAAGMPMTILRLWLKKCRGTDVRPRSDDDDDERNATNTRLLRLFAPHGIGEDVIRGAVDYHRRRRSGAIGASQTVATTC